MPQLSVNEDLVYLDGSRIVLPIQATKKFLPLLHVSHIGMNKTYDLCRSMYFWPGMFNDVKQMTTQCRSCNVHRPSQPKNPRSTQPPSSYFGPPMSHVGLDLFEFGGKQHSLRGPSIRSEGGPQFRGDFLQFCVDSGIKHELSAPNNPRSNGLAESG